METHEIENKFWDLESNLNEIESNYLDLEEQLAHFVTDSLLLIENLDLESLAIPIFAQSLIIRNYRDYKYQDLLKKLLVSKNFTPGLIYRTREIFTEKEFEPFLQYLLQNPNLDQYAREYYTNLKKSYDRRLTREQTKKA
jgi:hypothetical protein